MTSRPRRPVRAPGLDRRMPLVVCVDDDPAILSALRRLLRNEPYQILTTESPEEVLRWVEDRPVDLVLADQRMPGMRGTELLSAVTQRAPGTLFVILTGYPDTEIIVERTRHRIGRLLTKPWNDEDLKRTVRTLLGESPRHPRASTPLHRPGIGEGVSGARRRETSLRIDCTGMTAEEAMEVIQAGCSRLPRGGRATVLLDQLVRVGGSLAHFLKEITARVETAELPVDLHDDAGCVAALLRAMDRNSPRPDSPPGSPGGGPP
jgi:CheY-like chemotaxis protein